MVTVNGDRVLDDFIADVKVVNSYGQRGLTFGYPSGGEQKYENPSQVPIPLHLMGRSAKDYVE